jgi:dipeptidyl aminopeptidase/acylaminoacyl peptidase
VCRPASHGHNSISFPSSDGELIQAWLGVPAGPGPFPTILETHGGPSIVQGADFAPMAQAWIDHGFAYITVN